MLIDERVARNVIDASPQNRELPRREGFVGTIPEGDQLQTSAVDAIRRSRFRNVRRVLLNELRVLNWMKIFVVREFFEDEIRDRLSHDQRKTRTQARLPRLKLDRREWLLVQNLEKIVRDA